MASKTDIANLAMTRLGEDPFSDIDSDSGNPATLVNAIWTPVLEDTLCIGPENGWQFATRTYHSVDRDSITIASIAESDTSGDITITGTHALIVGDEVLLDDTAYDDTYVVNAISTTTTFDVTATFVATDTGTAYWTSEKYGYRFARPSCIKAVGVCVAGVELTDWIREGSYLLTNQESDEVDIHYILPAASLTVTNFPQHFNEVLWRKLAIQLAYKLVQKASFAPELITELEQITIPRSIGMDNKEKYAKESSNAWVAAGHTSSKIE